MPKRSLMVWILSVACTCGDVRAIVWEKGAEPEESHTGEMRRVGKLMYSPFKVVGGTCVAIGDKWVLTSRHGVRDWEKDSLTVSLPGLGKGGYSVKRIHFPEKGDLALLELSGKIGGFGKAGDAQLVSGANPVGVKVWLGGYGMSGPVGNVSLPGRFYSGYNRGDKERKGKWSISMSKPGQGENPEVTISACDSGSPLFVEHDGEWVLCGIASTASNSRNPGVGDRGSYAKVGPAVEWIKRVMRGQVDE